MKIIPSLIAAAMLVISPGVHAVGAPAPAAVRAAIAPAAQAEIIQVRGRDRDGSGRRRGHEWYDEPRHGDWRRDRGHRHHGYHRHGRRCYTEWVLRFGHYGPQFFPVTTCYRR